MSFEIGKKAASEGITESALTNKLQNNEKAANSAKSIFSMFNTNQTANGKGEQVLDEAEQAALMGYLKGIAGGSVDDTKISRRDLRKAKKEAKKEGDNNKLNDISYKDLKAVIKAIGETIGNGENVQNIEFVESQKNEDGNNSEANDEIVVKLTQYENSPEYTVDQKKGRVTSSKSGNDNTTYSYDDNSGNLSEIKETENDVSNNSLITKTTTFKDGKRSKVEQEYYMVMVGDTSRYVTSDSEGKQYTTIDDEKYEVKDNKITIEGKDYPVYKTTAATNYDTETGEMTDSIQVDKTETKSIETETKYEQGKRSTVQITDKDVSGDKTTTTENYAADEKTLIKKQISAKNKFGQQDTTINYSNGDMTKKEVVVKSTDNKIIKKEDTNYSTRTVTTTENGIITETHYSDAADKDGIFDDKNIDQKRVTDTTNHTRIKYNGNGAIQIAEILDDSNKTANRTATFDNDKVTIKEGDKTIELNIIDKSGYIIANTKANGTKYETAAQAAERLGFDKNSAGYNKIIQNNDNSADKATNGTIKLSKADDFINLLAGLKIDNAEVNADDEKKKIEAAKAKEKLNKINDNIQNAEEKSKAAKSKLESRNEINLRKTWASDNHYVFADTEYANSKNAKKQDKKDYQQHYVYNPITDELVKIEEVVDGIKEGEHVKYINADGTAHVVDQNGKQKNIKITFKNFESVMSAVKAKLTSGEATDTEMAQGAKESYDVKKSEETNNVTVPSGYEKTQTDNVIKKEVKSYAKGSRSHTEYYYYNNEAVKPAPVKITSEDAAKDINKDVMNKAAAIRSLTENNNDENWVNKMKYALNLYNNNKNNIKISEVLDAYKTAFGEELTDVIDEKTKTSAFSSDKTRQKQNRAILKANIVKKLAEEYGDDAKELDLFKNSDYKLDDYIKSADLKQGNQANVRLNYDYVIDALQEALKAKYAAEKNK